MGYESLGAPTGPAPLLPCLRECLFSRLAEVTEKIHDYQARIKSALDHGEFRANYCLLVKVYRRYCEEAEQIEIRLSDWTHSLEIECRKRRTVICGTPPGMSEDVGRKWIRGLEQWSRECPCSWCVSIRKAAQEEQSPEPGFSRPVEPVWRRFWKRLQNWLTRLRL